LFLLIILVNIDISNYEKESLSADTLTPEIEAQFRAERDEISKEYKRRKFFEIRKKE
jgi:hypothetical protein